MTLVQCSCVLSERAHSLEGFCGTASALRKVVTQKKPLTFSLELILKHSKHRTPLEKPGDRKSPLCVGTQGVRWAEVPDQATVSC